MIKKSRRGNKKVPFWILVFFPMFATSLFTNVSSLFLTFLIYDLDASNLNVVSLRYNAKKGLT